MTEGRGPMELDSLWSDKAEAIQYMDNQKGVMGREAKWSIQKFGDWELEEVKVFASSQEKFNEDNEFIRKKALAKLTFEEMKVLGLK